MATKLNFSNLTDDDLDRLSEVTEQDILDVYGRIVNAVQKKYANLIVADEFVAIEIDDASDT